MLMVVGIGVKLTLPNNHVTDVFDIDSGAGDRFPHTVSRPSAVVASGCRSFEIRSE